MIIAALLFGSIYYVLMGVAIRLDVVLMPKMLWIPLVVLVRHLTGVTVSEAVYGGIIGAIGALIAHVVVTVRQKASNDESM